ncbi:MAG: DUF4389 domain-containing protein [Candidatus Micrarchaeota archaeon]|nr:DUF4389 domain-containing protein [Candidatus Micrarchaeota archaeon]
MKTVKVEVKSDPKASRLELFVRILWGIVSGIVLWVFSIIAGICLMVHWIYILILGKRSKTLNNVVRAYFYYSTKYRAYLSLLTDERNPIIPEDE